MIDDYPILIVETFAIQEAIMVIVQKSIFNVIIENNSQIVIKCHQGRY